MTQEEKQLLLKDLCARLPYGIKVNVPYPNGESLIKKLIQITEEEDGITCIATYCSEDKNSSGELVSYKKELYALVDILPYLRPMSSMTEEEEKEYESCFQSDDTTAATLLVDFYNKHHIDYRGLIPMGLALEAPEGMYKK